MADNSLDFNALLKQVPLQEVASRLGVDQVTAQDAVSKALPGILGGLATNAQSEEGANALENALQSHRRDVTKLDDVDVEDGEKIVNHALGGKRKDVVAAVSDGNDDLVSQILPVLAPIVMAFLAKNLGDKRTSGGGGGISDILGSILGGGSGGLGGILGSIFGR